MSPARPKRKAKPKPRAAAAAKKPQAARRGATRVSAVPPAVLAQLNAGLIEAKTLAESLAVDFGALFGAAFPRAPRAVLTAIQQTRGVGVLERMRIAGSLLAGLGAAPIAAASEHPSDTVRGWAAFATANEAPDLAAALQKLKRFADDPNAGVREWAWMTIRNRVAADAASAVQQLLPWTADASPNVRRFASEATRPRGVWAAHIPVLTAMPAIGLPILERLRSDDSRYVQNSVANWLNDAAKDNATWVRSVTSRWTKESSTAATAYIVKRALRSLA